jgi:hypothetical protein
MVQTGPNHILPGKTSQGAQKKLWKKNQKDPRLPSFRFFFHDFYADFCATTGLTQTGRELVAPAYCAKV